MEKELIMNAFHDVYWGVPISIYFWLMGVSAGAHVISGFGWVFGLKKYKQVGLIATLWAILALLIVPLILIHDLGKPMRFFYLLLPFYWHNSAPMSWGTVLIMLYPCMMSIYAYFMYKNNERMAFIFGIGSILSAASTHWYTGVVIQLNPGRDLNHTAIASLLFLVGAFISGTGFLIVTFWIMNIFLNPLKKIRDSFQEGFIKRFIKACSIGEKVEDSLIVEMGQVMAIGIVVELILTLNEYLQMIYGTMEEQSNLYDVLLGAFRVPFLAYVFFAMLIPLFILYLSPIKRRPFGVAIAAGLVCIGIFGMRLWWVLGGLFQQSFY
ncbi:MAG: polysulfide reductase NrfD [Deltaproteobacteria bacterium]|nr:polysulfide reductase NrfD [Deltaproteobacteria bacterium]